MGAVGTSYAIWNGTHMRFLVTAFWIVPYFARDNIDHSDVEQHIDMSAARLWEPEDTTVTDRDYVETVEEHVRDDRDRRGGTGRRKRRRGET